MPACDGQTDGGTDGQTHDDSIYRASIASRGKNASTYTDKLPTAVNSGCLIPTLPHGLSAVITLGLLVHCLCSRDRISLVKYLYRHCK